MNDKWWERGIEQSKKMVISYDNLITRLWLSGAIMPYEKGGYASNHQLMDGTSLDAAVDGAIDTLVNEKGLPPIPHEFWVHRLGFQQGSCILMKWHLLPTAALFTCATQTHQYSFFKQNQ